MTASFERKNWQPLKHPDGSIHQKFLKVAGKPFRCECGCNVFHHPNDKDLNRFACNACKAEYETEK